MSHPKLAFGFSLTTEVHPDREKIRTPANTGKLFVRAPNAKSQLLIRSGVIPFPNPDADPGAFSDWLAFYETTLNDGVTPCLVKAPKAALREVEDEAIGTSSGGAGDSLALTRKYVDEDTLVVKVAGNVQPTNEWDLDQNETAPEIDTLSGFDAGAATASYEFWTLMFLFWTGGRYPDPDVNLGKQGHGFVLVDGTEVAAGDRFA